MTIKEQVQALSLEEKVALLQGETVWTTYGRRRVGIPKIFLADGPHGLRKQAGSGDHLGINESVEATCFPTAAAMANSWNEALGEELGEVLGQEAIANDVQVILGPGLNMKRSPLCGRNFEYFSEDPYLAGKMAASYVKGIQKRGVAACPKHFAVNSQELRRMAMDSVLDERTLREIYLTAFEIAVKEGNAQTVMSSYNMVNGVYANENAHLLTDILREEWGFDGFVMTDWGADNDHVEGVRAGSNLVMPTPGADSALSLLKAVQEGRIDESVLDKRLEELIRVAIATKDATEKAEKGFDKEAHHQLAQKCAEESIVLLENNGILPLAKERKIAIVGDFAKTPRYQGAGSSQVNPTKLDNLYDMAVTEGLNIVGYAQGFDRKNPQPIPKMIAEAASLAQKAEVVLLCVGLDEILESEGMDRTHMELSLGQQALIQAVTEANPNTVLVLSGGAPFVMPSENCYKAAIHGYLGGQAGAGAMLRALLGQVNPSGKLNESWPMKLSDTPCYHYFPSEQRTAEYREGLFVGYRYYDTKNVPVRYAFGHGISYTSFQYSALRVTKEGASFTLTNTGNVAGAEIAQLYIGCENSAIYRPKKELKGFKKVFLLPGESKEVSIAFDDKSFRYFDAKNNCWSVEEGEYTVYIAASSDDVRLEGSLIVAGTKATDTAPTCYKNAEIAAVSDQDFKQLLGVKELPSGKWEGELCPNDALCQMYYAKSGLARLLYRLLEHSRKKAEKKGVPDLNIMFIYNMPFRSMTKLTMGMVSTKMVEDILLIVNGRFFSGFGKLIVHFFQNLRQNRKFKRRLRQLDQ